VVAVGTTAVRALEGQAALHDGRLVAGRGITALAIDGHHRLRIVDGLLTGLHEPGTSHFELLQAFAPAELLRSANAHAEAAGYLAHEFGDSCLVLRG
jgi:S-adenosylmethionine:tRNA ribosyltransferase-isomerase